MVALASTSGNPFYFLSRLLCSCCFALTRAIHLGFLLLPLPPAGFTLSPSLFPTSFLFQLQQLLKHGPMRQCLCPLERRLCRSYLLTALALFPHSRHPQLLNDCVLGSQRVGAFRMRRLPRILSSPIRGLCQRRLTLWRRTLWRWGPLFLPSLRLLRYPPLYPRTPLCYRLVNIREGVVVEVVGRRSVLQ